MTIPVIFCDFDGTITNSDNIVSIMKQFAPSGWETLAENVLSQTISISSGVGKMFSLLDSSLKEEIIDYVKDTAVIRSGFAEFVHFTKEQEIPLFIVSGGMDFFIEPLLDGLVIRNVFIVIVLVSMKRKSSSNGRIVVILNVRKHVVVVNPLLCEK